MLFPRLQRGPCRFVRIGGTIAWAMLWLAQAGMAVVTGELRPWQVLVVYNSCDADSLAVWHRYLAVRPGVLGFDLDDTTLPAGTIDYATFKTKLRDPLRRHLAEAGLAEQVVVLVLTRGLPHRILDINQGAVGDNPVAAGQLLTAGNATYASVDCELTLLWQDLDEGEANGATDSAADGRIKNPFAGSAARIALHSRAQITTKKTFRRLSATRWQMLDGDTASTPGSIYLTSRLDGNSLAAVLGMIERGLQAVYHPAEDRIIQDADAAGTLDAGDYNLASQALAPMWAALLHDKTASFLVGTNGPLLAGNAPVGGPVAALTGYGANHQGGTKTGYLAIWAGQLVAGAVFNTYESFNGRKFGGVGGFGEQGQLADWIDAGGTFGLGTPWEPTAEGVAANSVLLPRFFNSGMNWVEAAWAATKYLSWQTIVVGDPLALASFGAITSPPTASVTASGRLDENSPATALATVTLSDLAAADTVVTLAFSGADLGADFRLLDASEAQVVIPANQHSASIRMTAVRDQLAEGVEVVHISVAQGPGYLAAAGAAMVEIDDTPYGAWLAENFGTGAAGAEAGPAADPDHDRLPNLLEYALGLDPMVADTVGGPVLSAEGDEAVFRFAWDSSKSDVACRVECSPDCCQWSPVMFRFAARNGTIETFEARRPLADAPACFFRLVVERLDEGRWK